MPYDAQRVLFECEKLIELIPAVGPREALSLLCAVVSTHSPRKCTLSVSLNEISCRRLSM